MTDEEISKTIDDVALELYGRGMDRNQVKRTIREEVDRACNELENEVNDFSR
ncbi:MAG TPA: hypothetical protein VJU84_08830 [Pyrinomonadaceae bacterium]|nr:hypothetical protein [Pyrinomonadaceae bacterium]